MSKRLLKRLTFLITCLIILEVVLQISGFFIRFKYKAKNSLDSNKDAVRIICIGDSWMQGFDTISDKKLCFIDLTTQALRELFPNRSIQVYNFGWGSTNSSQAIHQFLDHYQAIKPNLLVVLTGSNDFWNKQDIITARKRIIKEIHINNNYEPIKFNAYLINAFKKLKLIKLCNLIWYNLIYKPKEVRTPCTHPHQEISKYCIGFMKKLNENPTPYREEKIEYLINNYREGETDYNEFYELMMSCFEGDMVKAQEYLRSKNMLRLNLIKKDFSKKDIINSSGILEENLTYLKLLCDQEGIITVIMNYPHISLEFQNNNQSLERIAKKLDAIYVDCFKYFKENLTQDEWMKALTPWHVNYKGHEYIANILTSVLSGIIINL